MDVDRWRELGVYDPDEPDAADRAKVLAYLVSLGATEQELIDAASSLKGIPDAIAAYRVI